MASRLEKTIVTGFQALKDLHLIGFIHRDVKPLNFSLGSTQTTRRRLFLFDFGLARQILLPVQGTNELKLREPRKKVTFRGTVRYCSVNVHDNKEQGRHDDLISLLYTVVELITGELPWRGLNRRDCANVKRSIPDKRLFNVSFIRYSAAKQHCPACFTTLYTYLKGLEYKDVPNYELIKDKLDEALREKKATEDAPFDWEKGGRYYNKTGQNKIVPRRNKNPDEKVEKDSHSTIAEEAPSTIEDSATDGNTSGMSTADPENTLEDLQELQ
ncbi:unnamed protein product [Gongylonema pulchrum]|uniref:Protein kinase domain-containing protein n=1 Tax=Gongylonema pulchrum TaxID=637853 RepID=A0A3P6PCN7_9BILA|nr:unnamed protein product [Gongylonema pulchrum]